MSRVLALCLLAVVVCGALGATTRQRPMELRPIDEAVAPAAHSESEAASVRVLLQMHEAQSHEHRFQAEVNALVAALKRQAGADAAETDEAEAALDQAAIEHAIDAQDKADALAYETEQSQLTASADAADAIAADEQAEASDSFESGLFGEAAPSAPAESVEAESASEIDTEPFNAGSAALIEETDNVVASDAAENEERAAAAQQFELESSAAVTDQLAAEQVLNDVTHQFEAELSDEAPTPAAAESVEAEQESEIDTEPFNAGPAFIQETESESETETETETETEADETEFETEVFGEAPVPEDTTEIVEAQGTATEDEWNAGPASFVQESETESEEEASEFETEVFGEAPVPEDTTEIVEAQGTATEDEWNAGPASFVEFESESESESDSEDDESEEAMESDALLSGVDEGDEMAVNEAIARQIDMDASSDEVSMRSSLEQTEAVEQAANEAEAESELFDGTSLLQVGGDWKDPPVWWKAPEEEMANADQQPWPLDPNFPMSVLDPPPNLPLANIEDTNNYPPMADPNMAFNVDPTAFPQTTPKVGTEDPSFASFSINGR